MAFAELGRCSSPCDGSASVEEYAEVVARVRAGLLHRADDVVDTIAARMAALAADRPAISHRVSAPATHVYPKATMKEREISSLSLNSRLSVAGIEGDFARLATGGFVPVQHIADRPAEDPAGTAGQGRAEGEHG